MPAPVARDEGGSACGWAPCEKSGVIGKGWGVSVGVLGVSVRSRRAMSSQRLAPSTRRARLYGEFPGGNAAADSCRALSLSSASPAAVGAVCSAPLADLVE
eukprot:scaffold222938_cov30-Tisochrysis_lutea.AAC.1